MPGRRRADMPALAIAVATGILVAFPILVAVVVFSTSGSPWGWVWVVVTVCLFAVHVAFLRKAWREREVPPGPMTRSDRGD